MFFSIRSSLSKNILGQSPRLRIISLSVIPSRIRKMSSQAATSSATVAVCQLRSTEDPVHNLKISEKVIRSAVAAGAKACFLPEASDFINPSKTESRKFSLPLPKHEYTIGLQTLAKELGIVISVGVHEGPEDESEERVYNTHVLIGKDGGVLATYRKVWWCLTTPNIDTDRGIRFICLMLSYQNLLRLTAPLAHRSARASPNVFLLDKLSRLP